MGLLKIGIFDTNRRILAPRRSTQPTFTDTQERSGTYKTFSYSPDSP